MLSRRAPRDCIRAGLIAAAVSGLPSTLWAAGIGSDPMAATLAAGRLLRPQASTRAELIAPAAIAHLALSIGWSAVIAALLPRRSPTVGGSVRATVRASVRGAVLGAGIAVVDLGAAHLSSSPRMAGVRSLPVAPQVADHLVYGAVVAAGLRQGAPNRCRRPPKWHQVVENGYDHDR